MVQEVKKLKQFIIKYDEFFFIIVFLIMIFGYALNIKTCVGDEVWNFQNIYKMYNGYKIYVDANVVTTPLFHFIGLILFKVLGANFFVFKIYNLIMCVLLFLMSYKIFKLFNIEKFKALFLTNILFCIENSIILCTTNYNTLSIVLVLCGIFIILNKEKYRYYYFYESLFIVLIILTKQNIGIFYILGYITYIIINKIKFKSEIKIFIYTFGMLLLFSFILFLYGVLDGFVSYCFLGIKEFAENNNFSSVLYVCIMVIISSINALLIIYLSSTEKIKINGNEKKYVNILACFAYMLLFLSYPIFNSSHIKIAMFIQYMLLIYIIYLLLIKLKYSEKFKNIIITLNFTIITIFSVISIKYSVEYFSCIFNDKNDYRNIYFGTLFDDDVKAKINNVTEYIEHTEKDVIILSSKAAIYMMPLNRSNGVMDLPLLGNLGKYGECGLINELSKKKNCQVLIDKEKYSWQESDNIINYVKDNFRYIGEIGDMLIYEV